MTMTTIKGFAPRGFLREKLIATRGDQLIDLILAWDATAKVYRCGKYFVAKIIGRRGSPGGNSERIDYEIQHPDTWTVSSVSVK